MQLVYSETVVVTNFFLEYKICTLFQKKLFSNVPKSFNSLMKICNRSNYVIKKMKKKNSVAYNCHKYARSINFKQNKSLFVASIFCIVLTVVKTLVRQYLAGKI